MKVTCAVLFGVGGGNCAITVISKDKNPRM